jgi:hypothetical protein
MYSGSDRKEFGNSVVLEQYAAGRSATSHAQFEARVGQNRPFVDGGIAKGFIGYTKLVLVVSYNFEPNAVRVILVVRGLGAALEGYGVRKGIA